MRVVLDANVFVSGLVGWQRPTSAPGAIYRAWRDAAFDLVLSDHILDEIERTLHTTYFRQRLTTEQVEGVRGAIARQASVIAITHHVAGVASHPEDDVVLATAVSGDADFLVTGDLQLQKLGSYAGTAILSPRAFLELLEH